MWDREGVGARFTCFRTTEKKEKRVKAPEDIERQEKTDAKKRN